MKFSVVTSPIKTLKTDLTVCFVYEDSKQFSSTLSDLKYQFLSFPLDNVSKEDFSGKFGEHLLLYSSSKKTPKLLLVGLGERNAFTTERLRKTIASAIKKGSHTKAKHISLAPPVSETIDLHDTALASTEAVLLSQYAFDKYHTQLPKRHVINEVVYVLDKKSSVKEFDAGMRKGIVIAEATMHARDLANAPGNEIYPESLAKDAVIMGKKHGVTVTVFNKKKIIEQKMGGILGVSQGSEKEPRFIIMEYGKQYRSKGTIVFVGKGVTFDTGGISIKPSTNMADMKMDMSGAAAVIGALHGIAKLRLKSHVIGLVPTVENMPSGTAIKPGDIITHFNGKTSEVDNTDAEGRLILADALSYADRFNPSVVIDLATLTGACVVALGLHASGMMGNNQEYMDAMKRSGDSTYERVWQLPLFEEYEKQIKSDIADVKNVGGRWAGAITAALFLKHFIGNYPWIHLDIAGTAIQESEQEYIPKGSSGFGVRLLIDFVRNWKSNG